MLVLVVSSIVGDETQSDIITRTSLGNNYYVKLICVTLA